MNIQSITLNHNNEIKTVLECYNNSNSYVKDNTLEDDMDKIEYILNYTDYAVLYSTSIMMMLSVDNDDLMNTDNLYQYYNFLEALKDIPFRTVHKNNTRYIIMGASINDYKKVFRRINDLNNPFLLKVKEELYHNSIKEFYKDFIEDNIIDDKSFAKFVSGEYSTVINYDDVMDVVDTKNIKYKNIEVIDYCRLREVTDLLASYDINLPFIDILDMNNITLKIHNWGAEVFPICVVGDDNSILVSSSYSYLINRIYITDNDTNLNIRHILANKILCLQDENDLKEFRSNSSYYAYTNTNPQFANTKDYMEPIESETDIDKLSPLEVEELKKNLSDEYGEDITTLIDEVKDPKVSVYSDSSDKNDI